jgi:hypothetical protein
MTPHGRAVRRQPLPGRAIKVVGTLTVVIGILAAPCPAGAQGLRIPESVTLQAARESGSAARAFRRTARAVQAGQSASKRSAMRRILGALAGAAGGFFAGGYIGAAIEGDGCHCDDPGLKGFLIGAPVGAVAGAILGERFLF